MRAYTDLYYKMATPATGEGRVDRLSYVDVMTWIARGRSVAEVRGMLEGTARRAIDRSRRNKAALKTGKTEAILFSRNRRYWRDRAHETVQVGPHQLSFNRQAAR